MASIAEGQPRTIAREGQCSVVAACRPVCRRADGPSVRSRVNIPESQKAVGAQSGECRIAWGKGHGAHGLFMSKLRNLAVGGTVKQLRPPIVTAGRHPLAVR